MSDATSDAPSVRFTATLELHGKTASGFVVPAELVEALGQGRKPAVLVTIGAHTYRSSVAFMGGRFLVGVSAENRKAAGVEAGDMLDVRLTLDTARREVTVPPDLAAALAAQPLAQRAFAALSYSNQQRHVLSVDGAKTPETRERRITKVLESLT
jgi:hypothetical protein